MSRRCRRRGVARHRDPGARSTTTPRGAVDEDDVLAAPASAARRPRSSRRRRFDEMRPRRGVDVEATCRRRRRRPRLDDSGRVRARRDPFDRSSAGRAPAATDDAGRAGGAALRRTSRTRRRPSPSGGRAAARARADDLSLDAPSPTPGGSGRACLGRTAASTWATSWATCSARSPRWRRSPRRRPATELGDSGLADIFKEFKKGVDKQLGKEDYDTRYNLGIAYKEMGLIDEAIAEFQLAAKDEKRLLECSSMLGICFLEKGMPKLAIKWFEKGLKAPGRTRGGVPGPALRPGHRPRGRGRRGHGAEPVHRPLRPGRQLPRRRRQGPRAAGRRTA